MVKNSREKVTSIAELANNANAAILGKFLLVNEFLRIKIRMITNNRSAIDPPIA